jgi:eukaryotic-like serine/threonine-protein kinase
MYLSIDTGTNADLWFAQMTGAHMPSVFWRTPYREAWGVFSPDGRWVAYESNESGRMEIYVRPFRALDAKDSDATPTTGQWQVSTAGGIFPTWRPDGKEVFYLDPTGAMMAAPIMASGATLTVAVPVKLFQTHIDGGGVDTQQGRQYDIAPDGRFLINTDLNNAAAPITLIQNWNPDATRQ